jgi:antitoxin (DNA-binding transcriptional repressor) of toxin-antitoxin stability system
VKIDIVLRKGAKEARNRLPELLTAAEKGHSTIITQHGRPVALAPIAVPGAPRGQRTLTPWQGSGRGLWRKDSARALRRLRDEWSR